MEVEKLAAICLVAQKTAQEESYNGSAYVYSVVTGESYFYYLSRTLHGLTIGDFDGLRYYYSVSGVLREYLNSNLVARLTIEGVEFQAYGFMDEEFKFGRINGDLVSIYDSEHSRFFDFVIKAL